MSNCSCLRPGTTRASGVSPRRLTRSLVAAAWLLASLGTAATAQELLEGNSSPGLRRWDVSGGVGLQTVAAKDLGRSYSAWEGRWQPRIQVGRYLTPHLKVEVMGGSPATYEFYESTPVSLPGTPGPVFTTTAYRVRSLSVTSLATYQFLDNAFAHPFVSTGIDVGYRQTRETRDEQTRRQNGVTLIVPASRTSRNAVVLRPLVAAGFKSYFNERVFLRSETSLAFGRATATRVGLRLDLGIDF